MNYSKIFDGVYSVRSDWLFFLSDHNFDFNKLYKEGITFQRLSDKESMIDKLKSSSYLDWSVWSKRDKNWLSKAKQLEVNKKASEGIYSCVYLFSNMLDNTNYNKMC